jgi:hypothetical protein
VLVGEALPAGRVAQGELGEGAALLAHSHTSRHEVPRIAQRCDIEGYGSIGVPQPQELGLEGVQIRWVLVRGEAKDGADDHLPAGDPVSGQVDGRTAGRQGEPATGCGQDGELARESRAAFLCFFRRDAHPTLLPQAPGKGSRQRKT